MLEAKGPGYADKFLANLDPKYWFQHTGAQGLIEQARRQLRSVQGMGARIEWHVAEKKAAEAIKLLFERDQITEIRVVHTPPR